MTKAEIKIGGTYYAFVGKNRLDVRVDAKDKKAGWWVCTNTRTGKSIRVSRLEPKEAEKKESAKKDKPQSKVITEPGAKSKRAKPPTEKRLSALDAAFKALTDPKEPLSAFQMVEAMSAKGYWTSPGGKTPSATLYSAILRDLSKGTESRFVKSDRGRFAAKG